MRKLAGILIGVVLLGSLVMAQQVGDQATAGFDDGRTYLNSHMGNFRPPLMYRNSITLTGNPDAISIFEGMALVAQSGDNPAYVLIDLESGDPLWAMAFTGPLASLDYVAPFSNDIVLLGDPTTTAVSAVQVSTGTELWRHSNTGSPMGRYPLLSTQRAVFHGDSGLFAAEPASGMTFWQFSTTVGGAPITTATAPLAASSGQIYILDGDGTLHAIDACSGTINWSVGGVGSDGSDLVATAGMVFVSNRTTGTLRAIDSGTGVIVWTKTIGDFAMPALALAYDRLLVFFEDDSAARVTAYNPATGESVWQMSDTPGMPLHGLVANNHVYFYNSASDRIRILEAFTGTVVGSISQAGVRGLTAANGLLYVLLEEGIDIYERSHEIYLAQIADGGGASTLITLVNRETASAQGTIEFFDDQGAPLPLMIEGVALLPVTSVEFVIPANGSIKIQTAGETETATPGWARVASNRAITGTSVYQYTENNVILFEAGVGAAPPTTRARVFATRVSNSPENPFGTGLAIANPSDETANVTIQFRRVLPTSSTTTTTVTLGSLEHMARFLEELFPAGVAGPGVEGTLVITSDIPIVITALRTQRGFQMSSYPVAQ